MLFLQNCKAKREGKALGLPFICNAPEFHNLRDNHTSTNEAQGLPGISANRTLVQTAIVETAFGFTECHTEQSQSELWSVTVYASLSASTLKQRRAKFPVHNFLPDKYALLRFFRGFRTKNPYTARNHRIGISWHSYLTKRKCAQMCSVCCRFSWCKSRRHICAIWRVFAFLVSAIGGFHTGKSCAFRSKSSHYYYLKILICSH